MTWNNASLDNLIDYRDLGNALIRGHYNDHVTFTKDWESFANNAYSMSCLVAVQVFIYEYNDEYLVEIEVEDDSNGTHTHVSVKVPFEFMYEMMENHAA